MQLERVSFPSSGKLAEVAGVMWYPDDAAPRAILQISHGMMDYTERYAELAEAMVAAGYAVVGSDHLGHGRTAESAAELGYFGPRGARDTLVEDLHLMSELVRRRFPNTPLVLVGHSMGSFVARLYAERYGEELAGLILLGTAGRMPLRHLGRAVANLLIFFRGRRYRSRTLARMTFMGYNKRFGKDASRVAWITRDEAHLRRYAGDPLCRFIFTASAYRELFCMIGEINHGAWFHTLPKDLPVLLASGLDDPVGAYGRGVTWVKRRMERVGLSRVTLRLYDGARHELHHETNRADVFADIEGFLREALS